MQLGALHNELSAALADAGLEEPRREAARLLAYFLAIPLSDLYAHPDRPVDDRLLAVVRIAAQRRAQRVPLAYLTGCTEFFGLEFIVGPGVLIPRADSEVLVESALTASVRILRDKLRLLDICAGTGCIGISLAISLIKADRLDRLWLTEIDPAAAGFARQNLEKHDLSGQSSLELADLFPADPDLRWDLIVANPPYVASPVIQALMPEVRCHEPRLALDGGPDGLDFYRRLIGGAADRLNPGGCLLLEHGYDQAEAVARLIRETGRYECQPTVNDYGGRPRVSGGLLKVDRR